MRACSGDLTALYLVPTPTERPTHPLEDSRHVSRGTPTPRDATQPHGSARVTLVIIWMNSKGVRLKAGSPRLGLRCDCVSVTLSESPSEGRPSVPVMPLQSIRVAAAVSSSCAVFWGHGCFCLDGHGWSVITCVEVHGTTRQKKLSALWDDFKQ